MSIQSRCSIARDRTPRASTRLVHCDICPHLCAVDRTAGETGQCEMDNTLTVSAVSLHTGEEPAIGGEQGSCNVFVTGCNLHCISCQNHPISHLATGKPSTPAQLAERIDTVLSKGTSVLNIVTGTHQIVSLLPALALVFEAHPEITLVWNCSGYERIETLALLDGLVDVYLPDFKFWEPGVAEEIAATPDYPEVARNALREMARQVGPLTLDHDDRAIRGLIVRHLVLPGNLSGTEHVLRFIAEDLPEGAAVSLMNQFVPAGLSLDHPLLGRRLAPDEYDRAVSLLEQLGLEHGWIQE